MFGKQLLTITLCVSSGCSDPLAEPVSRNHGYTPDEIWLQEASGRFLLQEMATRSRVNDGEIRRGYTLDVMARFLSVCGIPIEADQIDERYPPRGIWSGANFNCYSMTTPRAPLDPRCQSHALASSTMPNNELQAELQRRQRMPDGAARRSQADRIVDLVENVCGKRIEPWCIDQIWSPERLRDGMAVSCNPL